MVDLSQFQQTYFEECAELLGDVEARLIALASNPNDVETLHAIFRAVHSIKGGAGAFGFERLVRFAHTFETLMEELRSGRVAVTRDGVSTLIQARDILAGIVDATRTHTTLPEDYGLAVGARLAALAGRPDRSAVSGKDEAQPDTQIEQRYSIVFAPHPELFRNASEPLHLLRELCGLGLATVTVDDSALPDLAELDPDTSYLSWTIDLITKASEAEIREVFEFVEDDCDLTIKRFGAEDDGPQADEATVAVVPPSSSSAVAARKEQPPSEPASAPPAIMVSGGDATRTTIRVDLEKIDRLVNMVGEIVITQAMLGEQVNQLPVDMYPRIVQGVEDLSAHVRELQESVMAIRAQPVKLIFARMQRIVHDTAGHLGKSVRLVLSGENTEVDKTVIEQLSDPLTHMVRNAIDHGIETPEVRRARGKPEEAVLSLSASQRGGRIMIEVADDGAGLNRPRILEKAKAAGIVQPDAILTDEEIDALIFHPGFSTADTVSDLSGRGVGMDVVKRNIQALSGRITVQSREGQGTRFEITLPLTLAVLDGMIVAVGAETYVLPLSAIIESLRPTRAMLNTLVNAADMLQIRGDFVPLIRLNRLFSVPAAIEDPTRGLVVLVEAEGGRRIGLMIDEMLGQQQVVIKSLESNYRPVPGVSGATILGDGRVALILDVTLLAQSWEDGHSQGKRSEGDQAGSQRSGSGQSAHQRTGPSASETGSSGRRKRGDPAPRDTRKGVH